ncbi:MAG TPA: DNA polymerase III subunit gamma/tau, partial [Aeromicrobium sp.]|nr:DNA polymerase III subunit gamma/tau [Aeromicrobium sp.]
LVEEPPPHLKFIFATTEPDKVIGTIRSRTHHYPFRLVPPATLTDYLGKVSDAEHVAVEPAALPLVVRAGAGSVRDSLSVLDQLLGGAGEQGLTYDLAVRLLGYTPDTLLDEAVDAMAAGDGATVFGVVDKVIESGQDPRRFAEDLLQRLRDLIVISVIPDAGAQGLVEVPEDRIEQLKAQAKGFGPAELTRTADIVNTALVDFRGATAPRMLLELMCARILVPGADASLGGLQARLDRLEKRILSSGSPTPADESRIPADESPIPADESNSGRDEPTRPAEEPRSSGARNTRAPEPTAPAPAAVTPDQQPVTREPEPVTPEPEQVTHQRDAGAMSSADLRRLWPEVLTKVQALRRFAWVILSQNSQVVGVEGDTLTLGLVNAGARESFEKNKVAEPLAQALSEVVGGTWRIETIIDVTAGSRETPQTSTPTPPKPAAPPAAPEAIQQARDRLHEQAEEHDPDADASVDDPVVDDGSTDPVDLLSRELGAEIIDESTHE